MSTILTTQVTNKFKETFNTKPTVVFSPGRINIIGEHTDYNGGFVFPAAVNKGIAAAIAKTNATKSTLIAMDVNSSISFNLKDIAPTPKPSWQNYIFGVVAELQKLDKFISNFNLVFKGNVPAGSGMSSSAALENSIVFGLNHIFNLGLSKPEMILISQKAEHNFVGVNCGIMDQYASMFGIKNNALLLDCKTIEATPYKIDFKAHQLLLINTNVKHSLSDSAYNNRRAVCEHIAKLLKVSTLRDATKGQLAKIKNKLNPEDYQKGLYVIEEIERTQQAARAIKNNDLNTLGTLMYASHKGLKNQYNVSCTELDFLVNEAKKNKQVLGARMMGGGFGGCTINLVARNAAKQFTETVSKPYKTKFNKDCAVYFVELADGTHIVK